MNEGVKSIVKAIVGVACMAVLAKFGYTEPITKQKTYVRQYRPLNYIESSIKALADEAVGADFDSSMKNYALNIVDILASNWDGIDNTTKRFAVDQLKRISSNMDFDSSKQFVSGLITKIAKGAVK